MNREAIHTHLPVVFQHAAVSLEGMRIQWRHYGTGYQAAERAITEQGRMTEAHLQAFRASRLRDFMRLASRPPFWKRQFAAYGVNPDSRAPFDELAKLPVLAKDAVKENVTDIINPTIDKATLRWRHTSGTTGSGLVFPETRETEWATWAHWWRYRRWHGLEPTMWCGYFGGRCSRCAASLRHSGASIGLVGN